VCDLENLVNEEAIARVGLAAPHKKISFLLEAESTTESQCGRKDYFNEKF
jgi:hypothetical protein